MKTGPLFCYLIVLVLIITATGCGGMRVEYVEGKVTHQGEPVEEATVVFSPASGSSTAIAAIGKTDKSGVYKLTAQTNTEKGSNKGTTAGEYLVSITKTVGGYDENLIGKSSEEISELQRLANFGKYTPKMVPYENKLPLKYKDPKTSGLTATVKRGKNLGLDFNIPE